jgi:hypothetical protein
LGSVTVTCSVAIVPPACLQSMSCLVDGQAIMRIAGSQLRSAPK